MCRLMFRKALGYDLDRVGETMALSEREAIRDPRLLVQGLGVLALVVAAFVLHPVLVPAGPRSTGGPARAAAGRASPGCANGWARRRAAYAGEAGGRVACGVG